MADFRDGDAKIYYEQLCTSELYAETDAGSWDNRLSFWSFQCVSLLENLKKTTGKLGMRTRICFLRNIVVLEPIYDILLCEFSQSLSPMRSESPEGMVLPFFTIVIHYKTITLNALHITIFRIKNPETKDLMEVF